MERIIYGIHLEGKRVPDAWDISIFEVNGHREVSARNVIEWTETIDMGFDYKLDAPDPVRDAAWLEERKERSLKKAAQRAQTQCRRLIKASNFREMLTITYRENQENRELCKEHFAKWVRAMVYVLPKFNYVASFEKQDRGAMHVHCCTNKLPKWVHYKGQKIEGWKLGTAVWRSIVGEDNGLVFVGGKSRWGGVTRRKNLSLAKMASYVSKYIMKDYADCPAGSQRYTRSHNIDLPKPEHIRITGCTLAQAIEIMFECKEGDIVVSHRVGRWGDSYWLCTEPRL